MPDLEESLQLFRDTNLLGGLNVYLEEAMILRIQQVTDLLVDYGLIDLVRRFFWRHRFQDLNTWSQVRQGIVL